MAILDISKTANHVKHKKLSQHKLSKLKNELLFKVKGSIMEGL